MAWITGIPILLIVSTGILLQIKNWVPWIQPTMLKGTTTLPFVDLNTIFQAARTLPEIKVNEWKDIRSIDIRPSSGTARVRTSSDYEVTIDLGTGKVLQAAPRRTNLLIELHQGSYFGNEIQYGVFFPVAVLFLALWGTGIFLLLRPFRSRRQQRTRESVLHLGETANVR